MAYTAPTRHVRPRAAQWPRWTRARLAQGGLHPCLLGLAAVGLGLLLPASTFAWSYGSNTVQNPSEDSASNVGYGPGWVLLSYRPNCPGVGYAFSEGLFGKTSPDHMKINDTKDSTYGYNPPDGKPAITRWPWGYVHGAYDGCAFSYGTSKWEFVGAASALCSSAPALPADRCATSSFCTNQSADSLCSTRGVWGSRDGEPDGKDAYSLGCDVHANISHHGVFGGTAAPRHHLGYVAAGKRLDIRYVTKDRTYAWGKVRGEPFAHGIAWGFFPRSCVSLTPPPSLCGNGAIDAPEQCDDGNTSVGDCCSPTCTFESTSVACGNGCDGRYCDGAGSCR